MATDEHEAYEMNATRSARQNTSRVVDNSYRPLTSSEAIHSGASPHSEADKREPAASALQEDEMIEDHEVKNCMQYRSSETSKRGNPLDNFTETYRRGALDSWFYECAALAFSVGCLAALAVMLGIYDGKETPQLPYNITLNALISALSTAAKSSLLFAVAGTLGQVKWAWFTENRKLSDMQTFDDATRGPWGALVLLCSRSVRPLASLGAVITILALAYGPFLQQLVRYPVVYESVPSFEASTKRATSLNATSNFTNWDSARVAAWLDLRQLDRDPGCPTGNCSWPTFTSLGYCSKCDIATAEVSLKCSAVFDRWDAKSNETCEIYPDQGYPATVWQGIVTNSTNYSFSKVDSIVWVVRETAVYGRNEALYEPFITTDPAPKSAFQSVNSGRYSYLGVENPMLVVAHASFDYKDYKPSLDDGMGPDPLVGSSTPVLSKAETCIITPCERIYQLSMTAGQVRTVVIDTDYGVSEILGDPQDHDSTTILPSNRCWRTNSYRRATNAPLPPVEECISKYGKSKPVVTACHGGDSASGYIFCSRKYPDAIGLLGREGLRTSSEDGVMYVEYDHLAEKLDVMTMGFPTGGMTTSQAVRAHNFSYLVERMAASMTKAELDYSSTVIYGNMSSGVVQVDVAWRWFALPAALNAVAIFLLLATAVLSHNRKTQLWKSSTLALLYHGFDDPEPALDLDLAKVSEMGRWASNTRATLGPAKDGGRVVLKTHPRE
jgi:hypothetical protein